MANSFGFIQKVSVDGVVFVNNTITNTWEASNTLVVTVPASSTDMLVAFTLDVSQCKVFAILADAAMTVETNSSGSPAATVTLTADKAKAWCSDVDAAASHPFGTTDVTALYVTSTPGGTLTIVCGYDPVV